MSRSCLGACENLAVKMLPTCVECLFTIQVNEIKNGY